MRLPYLLIPRQILLSSTSKTIPQTQQILRAIQIHTRRNSTHTKMSEAKEFPPQKIRSIVAEVASLLKQKGETVSVAETVRFSPIRTDPITCFPIRPLP